MLDLIDDLEMQMRKLDLKKEMKRYEKQYGAASSSPKKGKKGEKAPMTAKPDAPPPPVSPTLHT